MSKRYDKKVIAKACRLRAEGVSLREIMKRTGIKSTTSIRYACDPVFRENMNDRTNKWRQKNRTRAREINRRATEAYQKKIRDSE